MTDFTEETPEEAGEFNRIVDFNELRDKMKEKDND